MARRRNSPPATIEAVKMQAVEPSDRSERKRRGAWYTPPELVEFLVEQAVGLAEGGRAGSGTLPRVLDPACGDGRLLAAVARRLGPGVDLVGIEVDHETAAEARRVVPSARIVVGDGRTVEPGGSFDVVIGNPPYLGQLARSTSRGGRSSLGGGPYADVAAEFLARSLLLARPDGGRVALVLPQSVLATRDTGPIRAAVAAEAAVVGFWSASEQVFAARVNVCVVVLQRGRPQGAVRRWQGAGFAGLEAAPASAVSGPTWAPLIADLAGLPSVELPEGHGRLADLASATAGFRQHFYGLIPFVGDEREGPPLVTSGLIDAGRCWWGARPARFAKRTFAAPRVDLADLGRADPALAAWVGRQLRPKVLVAAQTQVIEAVVDEDGAWVPSVPVVAVHPRRVEDLWAVGAVLLAPPVAAWAAARYLGAGLGATALKLSATQVLGLPLPHRHWAAAAQQLRAGDIDGCAVQMCAAYGLDPATAEPLLAWWRRAIAPRRSRSPLVVEPSRAAAAAGSRGG